MRLWSLHPEYLDPAGLVALWRESLLAQAVLSGQTRGYRHHPQLLRFQQENNPLGLIATYLSHIMKESERRGYSFDRTKIASGRTRRVLPVSEGQLRFEWEHLKRKLRVRNRASFGRIAKLELPIPHPLFMLVPGPIADWERG